MTNIKRLQLFLFDYNILFYSCNLSIHDNVNIWKITPFSSFIKCCSDSTFSERYLNSFSLKVANQLPSPSTAISVYMIRTPIYSKHMEVWFKTCFTVFYSPRNENLNLLIRIKFLNLFLYSSKKKTEKIYWSEQRFTGLGLEDRCSSWGLILYLYLEWNKIWIYS